jgi:transposase
MYVKVHDLHKEGFSVSAIARKVGLSRNTVYKYLGMSFEEVNEWVNTIRKKKRKLDPYRGWILSWLREHPDMSSAQVHDWLKERVPEIKVGESTVRSYVAELRHEYAIPKTVTKREYEAVEELPPGQQMQVDFGHQTAKDVQGKEVKLSFIAFVLAHSRYKFAVWQDRPFTTRDVIRCHELAFEYFGGRTHEIVYDQDHLISVSENAGDLLLTSEFLAYQVDKGFKVYLCRKNDPESKGKIESAVKFFKNNYGKHRIFTNIDSWNEECLLWLDRTGNCNIHNTTKKRPQEVFLLEKQHLKPVSPILSFESQDAYIITRNVQKDNVVKYKSNRYSVPIGTYKSKGNNRVYLRLEEDHLIIETAPKGDVLARHVLQRGKGKLIKLREHGRDRSKGIQAWMEKLKVQFEDQENVSQFLAEIRERYPRYIRDQLQVLQKAVTEYRKSIDDALSLCMKDGLWSANDFYDAARYLSQKQMLGHQQICAENPSGKQLAAMQEKAAERPLESYLTILGGAE